MAEAEKQEERLCELDESRRVELKKTTSELTDMRERQRGLVNELREQRQEADALRAGSKETGYLA